MSPLQPTIRKNLSIKACDTCRQRKVKCHRNQIRCLRCERLGLHCTFLSPSKIRGPKARRRLPADTIPHSLSSKVIRDDANHDDTRRHHYPTDEISGRDTFKMILDDYLDHLYPLVPIVHRPSFRQDIQNDRDCEDSNFLGLILAISGLVVATLPSRFKYYQSLDPPLNFKSRRSMVNYCADRISRQRIATYFDQVNFQKFATSYLLYAAFLQVGDQNRSRMFDIEAMQIARLLNLHCLSKYGGLNYIEIQLRKKGFWLVFYAFVHARLQNVFEERLSYLDPALLQSINPEGLMPLDVDDEFIFEDKVLVPTNTYPSVTSGFIIHSRVFWAAIRNVSPDHSVEEPCACSCASHPRVHISYLRDRLESLKSLQDTPAFLRSCGIVTENDYGMSLILDTALQSNFTTMRINLQITHLWLQSLLIDRIEVAQVGITRQMSLRPANEISEITEQRTLWIQREKLCRQMMLVLDDIPQANLEANGLHLVYKVRDLASGLLTCPFEPWEPEAKRTADLVKYMTNLLSRLDNSEEVNSMYLQSWVDTDRARCWTKNFPH